MSIFHIELTKVIVVSLQADSYEEACQWINDVGASQRPFNDEETA